MRTGILLMAALAAAIAAPALADRPARSAAGASEVATAAQLHPARPAVRVPPSNRVAPEVSGSLREGQVVLTLPGIWNGDPPLRFSNRWERCDARRCTPTGQTGFLTRLVAADVGRRMRTQVTASNDAGTATASSRQSGLVRPRLRWIDPFPVVGLRGIITRRGVYVSRLAVRAPRGALLRVSCRGRGCPYRRSSARFRRGLVLVRRMHRRTLAVNTVFSLSITQGEDRIGKYTRFRVRSRRRPARIDRCLVAGDTSPSRCGTRSSLSAAGRPRP